MTKHLLSHPRIRIGVFTKRKHLLLAEETVSTSDRKWHNHAIADFQVVHLSTELNYFPHEFMAEYVAFLHCRNESVVEVQVGAADCCRRNFYDRIALVEDLRVRNLLHAHCCFAVPTVGSHRCIVLPSVP